MEGSERKEEKRRRRRTRSKGSQTEENDDISEECCVSCRTMPTTSLEEINNVALQRIKEINGIRERQALLKKESRMLKECLLCPQENRRSEDRNSNKHPSTR